MWTTKKWKTEAHTFSDDVSYGSGDLYHENDFDDENDYDDENDSLIDDESDDHDDENDF